MTDQQTDTCLTASFPEKTYEWQYQKCKPFWILIKQEMMGMTMASASPYANHSQVHFALNR